MHFKICIKWNHIVWSVKNTKNIDPETSSSSNGRAMILSKYAICGSRKSRFIKNQEGKGLLSNLGIKTPLSKVPISGDILLWMRIKMNEIVIKFLSVGEIFMPDMHSKQSGFTYSACRPFTENKEFKNLKKQEILAIFTKTNLVRLVFSMIWLMGILKI